ncbi:amidase [Sinorhizobium sp. 7-81]|uniref:amidase n=1 Tax=unclassified Sinorhizobium TaxID=2613772 RepID=UPI0024C24F53|nr:MULTISPECIES: amidase [unclassified Sinorhizobium]MDK1389662.1 amidase [Sinorhizobium sp. 7-81]MDK1493703.1 amidase [Sinorhizobium sp. 8-89]
MSAEKNTAIELARLDGVAQAELVRKGELSARELVQAAIHRIEAGNGVVNAVVHRRFEQALEEADFVRPGSTAPLAGVPFLLKDTTGAAQAGVPHTLGNIALKRINYTAEADSALGARFKEAGLVTLGVTSMPEFGQLCDTQSLAFGPTRNPWSLDHSVGGSSGGSAAAVAAGFVPVAHAGDGGGSIRQPAAWCGVFGLKPSRGRMPKLVGSIDDIYSVPFVISRTVRDSAVVLDAVNGSLPGDPFSLPRPSAPYFADLGAPARVLRIGLLTDAPGGLKVDPECVRAVEDVGKLLQAAGHNVELTHPSAILETKPGWVDRVRFGDCFPAAIAHLAKVLGRPVEEKDVEPRTWAEYQKNLGLSSQDLRESWNWHLARSARMLQWWEQGFDLLVTPVVHQLQYRLKEVAESSFEQQSAIDLSESVFLEPFNASGQPAMVFPVRWTEEQLPVGVQVAAARGEDRLLLQVATQMEQAIGWPSRLASLEPPAGLQGA